MVHDRSGLVDMKNRTESFYEVEVEVVVVDALEVLTLGVRVGVRVRVVVLTYLVVASDV